MAALPLDLVIMPLREPSPTSRWGVNLPVRRRQTSRNNAFCLNSLSPVILTRMLFFTRIAIPVSVEEALTFWSNTLMLTAMTEYDQFGVAIRELRLKANLSLRELAARVGIDFTYLSKIENGILKPPSEKVVLRLAEVFGAGSNKLLALAGRIPWDTAQKLKSQALLEFGPKLRDLRMQAGLSLRELGDKAGIDPTYISKIESGAKPPPSKKVILRLAQALDVNEEELLILAGRIPHGMIVGRITHSSRCQRGNHSTGKE